MKIVLSWAMAAPATGPSARPRASTPTSHTRPFMLSSLSTLCPGTPRLRRGASERRGVWGVVRRPPMSSMRERPQSQLLLGDLPKSGEPVRLDDEEEDDESAEDHDLELLLQGNGHRHAEGMGGVGQQDGDEHDEGGAQKGAEDTAQTADDDHEEHQERHVD